MRLDHRLTGAALALLSVAPASAEVVISAARTDGIATSTANNGAADDVSVSTGGSIKVTSGAAITLDSSNIVTNSGSLNALDADGVTGIRIVGAQTGSETNAGVISLLGTLTLADTDSDGDLDTPFATGANRTGVLLDSGASLTGPISNTGTITVTGADSYGVRLRGALVGPFTNTGTISATGDRAIGITVQGPVTGDVETSGGITVLGDGAVGLLVTAPVSGHLRINGAVSATGYRYVYRPTDAVIALLDGDDLLQGGPAVKVTSSLGGGLEVQGIGVEDDLDDDGDGILEDVDTDDDATAMITSSGGAPALLVSSAGTGSNIVFGEARDGYGLVVRGGLYAYGYYDGVPATALRVEGDAGASVSIYGGILNDRILFAQAYEADAAAISIGPDVSAPTILNRGTITASSVSNSAVRALGIFVDSGAAVSAIGNTGSITTTGNGENVSAYAILDRSGGVTSVSNTGSIIARVSAPDTNLTDGITPVALGHAVAIDLTANTTGVTITQSPDVVFTDQDTVDNDASSRPAVQIVGDVFTGTGNDFFDVSSGKVTGNVDLGVGADIFNLSGGATYTGKLTDADGQLTLNVTDATLALTGGALNLTSAHFGDGSTLSVTLDAVGGTVITATGNVVFDNGAKLTAIVPSGLPDSGAITFLHAGTLTGVANVTGPVTGANTPFVYTLDIETVSGDANALQALYTRKTAAALGLDRNQTAMYEPLIAALRLDATAETAFTGLTSQNAFTAAYNTILPTTSAATTELLRSALDQGQRVALDRIDTVRDADAANVWIQEIGYGVVRAGGVDATGYKGNGFGVAIGVDAPLMNGGSFGLTGSFTTSESKGDAGDDDDLITTTLAQASAYWGFSTGPVQWSALIGGGGGTADSKRRIVIGSNLDESAKADWTVGEGHAQLVAQTPLGLGAGFAITPRLGLAYEWLYEGAHQETGASGLNLAYDAADSQRLRGEAGVQLSRRGSLGGAPVTARIYGGWREELLDGAVERRIHFASGTTPFTLYDDPVAESGGVVGLGLDAHGKFISVGFSYEGEFRDDLERHGLSANVRVNF